MKRQKTFSNNDSKLYIVATPIGNLEDITIRALNVLKMVDIIYCEDTRVSKRLLNHYDINTNLKSYHLFNENTITDQIIDNLLEGKNVAIISDAGCPTIRDPGWVAISEAIKKDIDVVVVPGASAGLTALIGSGMPAQSFYFAGFLNSKKGKRKEELKLIAKRTETVILYEAPHKLLDTLKMIDELMPERKIVLARELTKKFEEYIRGTASEILEIANELKGEMVIILEGMSEKTINGELNKLSIKEHYQHYYDLGVEDKIAIKQVAIERNIPKREVYEIIHKNK